MNHPLASYLKRFFSHYLPVQKGLSPHTLAAYRDAVKLLLGYLADTLKLSVDALDVEAITAARVSDFLDHLEQVRGCRTVTRNARLAAIRTTLGTQMRTTASVRGEHGEQIHIRKSNYPNASQQKLLRALELPWNPGKTQKTVVTP